jgi:hypothetical protein
VACQCYFYPFVHKPKEVDTQSVKEVSMDTNGLVMGIKWLGTWMEGDGFATKPGGIMEVAMWLCALLLVGL